MSLSILSCHILVNIDTFEHNISDVHVQVQVHNANAGLYTRFQVSTSSNTFIYFVGIERLFIVNVFYLSQILKNIK